MYHTVFVLSVYLRQFSYFFHAKSAEVQQEILNEKNRKIDEGKQKAQRLYDTFN
jgi:hypothetical protein